MNTTSDWQLRCPKCGFTKNLAGTGAVRVGAVSRGKRVLGRCPDCRWFRFFIMERVPEAKASHG
jgi:DNA-directed RNA polymerase subunit RPC12/RpoP